MSGEQNGTKVFLQLLVNGSYLMIGGQINHSQTLSNSIIEVTNKSAGEQPRFVDGEGTLSEAMSLEIIFSSDAAALALRDLVASKSIGAFNIIKPGFADEAFTAMVGSYAENSPNNAAMTASFSMKIGQDSTLPAVLSNKTFGGVAVATPSTPITLATSTAALSTSTAVILANSTPSRNILLRSITTNATVDDDYSVTLRSNGVDIYSSVFLSDALNDTSPVDFTISNDLEVFVENFDGTNVLNMDVVIDFVDI